MSSNEKDRSVASVARDRILESAYDLFSTEGVNAVGVDTVVAKSGSGKMTLYRHFKSKDALVLAFLELREELWTRQWLQTRISEGTKGPEERLLSIFDIFNEWFQKPDFEGCSFINSLLEGRQTDSIRNASSQHLAHIRAIIEKLAREARLIDVEKFARAWHVLMKGSIVARHEGQLNAAIETQATARLLLGSWPRLARSSGARSA